MNFNTKNTHYQANKKPNKFLTFLCAIFFAGLFGTGFVLIISHFTKKYNEADRKEIANNPVSIVGRIHDIRSYKGHSFGITYNFNEVKYETYQHIISNQLFYKYKVGDTISIIISEKNLNIIVLKNQ